MESCVHPGSNRWVGACVGALLLVATAFEASAAAPVAIRETVGHKAGGRSVTPVNQTLTPLGRQIELPGLRPQVLALSPDGSRLLVSGKTSELLVLSPVTGEILQRVALPSEQVNEPQPTVPSSNILKPDAKGQVSYTGLVYSPDGKRVVLSNVNGSLKVFRVESDGSLSASHSLPPSAPRVGDCMSAPICRTGSWNWMPIRARCCASSVSAWLPMTWCWWGTRPMSAIGAGVGRGPMISRGPPVGAPPSAWTRCATSPARDPSRSST